MPNVNKKMGKQGKKNSEPQGIKNFTRKIKGQKTHPKKRNEFLINAKCKTLICKPLVVFHNLRKAFIQPGILSKKTSKTNKFFHVVKNKNDWQKQNKIFHKVLPCKRAHNKCYRCVTYFYLPQRKGKVNKNEKRDTI